MNAATLLRILRDVVDLIDKSGFMTATGFDDTKFASIQQDAVLATGIEAILKKYGVLVPGQVDRIIQLLPLLAGFIR